MGGTTGRSLEAGQYVSVLVVDDDRSIASHLAEGLSLLGFGVVTANSAAEAENLLTTMPGIAVVVTDIRMPGGDGLSFAGRLLSGQCERDPIEVVLITGHATEEDVERAMLTGVSDVLRKPFRLKTAAEAVASALEKARMRHGRH